MNRLNTLSLSQTSKDTKLKSKVVLVLDFALDLIWTLKYCDPTDFKE